MKKGSLYIILCILFSFHLSKVNGRHKKKIKAWARSPTQRPTRVPTPGIYYYTTTTTTTTTTTEEPTTTEETSTTTTSTTTTTTTEEPTTTTTTTVEPTTTEETSTTTSTTTTTTEEPTTTTTTTEEPTTTTTTEEPTTTEETSTTTTTTTTTTTEEPTTTIEETITTTGYTPTDIEHGTTGSVIVVTEKPETSNGGQITVYPECDGTSSDFIYLSNSMFEDGTYRIETSGNYALLEDIIFSPRENYDEPNYYKSFICIADNNKDETAEKYPGSNKNSCCGSFKLGFFAAISIEADDVNINLCGHTIKMSDAMYIQQRFYSNIEIGTAPFYEGEGPYHVGEDEHGVSNVYIYNGALGLSSHHGIHGNSPINVLIEDLIISDFEVGGIQFNGYKDVTIRRVIIESSSRQVKSNGFYSAARYMINPLEKLYEKDPTALVDFSDRDSSVQVQDIFDEFTEQMDLFFKYVLGFVTKDELQALNDGSYEQLLDAIELFGNTGELPDGAALYGILLHSATQATSAWSKVGEISYNALIEDVTIRDLSLNTKEFVGYIPENENEVYVTGPYGDAIDMRTIACNIENKEYSVELDNLKELEFCGNALVDAQIALGIYVDLVRGGEGATMRVLQDLDSDFMLWATDSGELKGEMSCNQDAMRHLNKGIIGIRIEESENVVLKNVVIDGLSNITPKGVNICGGYTGPENGGHEHQSFFEGYRAADCRAISFFKTDATLENIAISNIDSMNGNANGMDIMQDSTVTLSGEIDIDGVYAGYELTDEDLADAADPNTPSFVPRACDIHVHSQNNVVNGLENVESSNIVGAEGSAGCDEDRR